MYNKNIVNLYADIGELDKIFVSQDEARAFLDEVNTNLIKVNYEGFINGNRKGIIKGGLIGVLASGAVMGIIYMINKHTSKKQKEDSK